MQPGMRATLLGLGEASDQLDREIDGFLLRAPKPTSSEVSSFLQLYSGEDRSRAARRLIERGVSPTAVSNALSWLDTSSKFRISANTWNGILTLASAAASAYHGYRRNQSIPWAAVWFAFGTIFPIFTSVIALAQGYAKPKR